MEISLADLRLLFYRTDGKADRYGRALRHVAGILPEMRVRYGSRVFNVQSAIDVNDRHKDHVLLCEEAVSG